MATYQRKKQVRYSDGFNIFYFVVPVLVGLALVQSFEMAFEVVVVLLGLVVILVVILALFILGLMNYRKKLKNRTVDTLGIDKTEEAEVKIAGGEYAKKVAEKHSLEEKR